MATKCLVKHCVNYSDEGFGIKIGAMWICAPCWHFLLKPEQLTNQVYRNAVGLFANYLATQNGVKSHAKQNHARKTSKSSAR